MGLKWRPPSPDTPSSMTMIQVLRPMSRSPKLGPDSGDVVCACFGAVAASDLVCTICGASGPAERAVERDEEARVAMWARRELTRCPVCTAQWPAHACADCRETVRNRTIVISPESPTAPLRWPAD
jgi:hypothetical protein